MTQLSEIDSLFTKSWNAYKPHIGYYALLTLVLSLIMFAALAIVGVVLFFVGAQPGIHIIQWIYNLFNDTGDTVPSAGDFIQISIVFVLFFLAVWIMRSWNTAAMWIAVTEDAKPGIGAVISRSLSMIPRYFGITLLRGLLIMAGYIFFIVPGIIFSGWFTFAMIAAQKQGVIDSLKSSRALVVGRWWAIIGRLILATIITAIAPQIITSMSSAAISTTSKSMIGPIIVIVIAVVITIVRIFFLTPWYMVFKNTLYQDALEEPQL